MEVTAGESLADMGIVEHTAMNLIRSSKATASLELRRVAAAWNAAYLLHVLRGSAGKPARDPPWEVLDWPDWRDWPDLTRSQFRSTMKAKWRIA